MRNKILLSTLLVVVSLGFAGCSLLNKVKNPVQSLLNKEKGTAVSTEKEDATGDSISGKLADLLKLNKTVKCTYNGDVSENEVDVVLYVNGKKFRTDSVVKDPEEDEPVESHMISDGEYAYVWTTEKEPGMKMKYTDFETDENKDSVNKMKSGSITDEVMKAYDYKCSIWIPDASKFKVPTNIKFQDLSELMKSMEEMTKNMKGDLCVQCDELDTEEQIASCRQSIKCDE